MLKERKKDQKRKKKGLDNVRIVRDVRLTACFSTKVLVTHLSCRAFGSRNPFTFWTIPRVVAAIQGIRRVLKADGKLIFFEHGLAPDRAVQRWQERTEPLFHWTVEGCHVTRGIPSLSARVASRSNRWRQVHHPISKVWVVLLVGCGGSGLQSKGQSVLQVRGQRAESRSRPGEV
jgi:hypothetical protein